MSGQVREILKLWPSLEALARDFRTIGHDVSAVSISKWAQRDRIPAKFWLPLSELARQRGISNVTFERLAGLWWEHKPSNPTDREACA